MSKFLLVFFLLLAGTWNTSGATTDSLLQALGAESKDTGKVKIYYQLAALLQYSEPERVRLYAYKMLNLSEKSAYAKGTYRAYRMLADIRRCLDSLNAPLCRKDHARQ